MIKLERPQDLARLQRIALTAQGLLQAKPFGQGLHGALNTVSQLGYVQIDTISVIERAHHHVLYSRVPKFTPAMINELLVDRSIFEYWSHAAAFLPIDDYRFSLPYKHAIKSGQIHWYKNPDKKLMAELLARIRTEGPLRSRDIQSASQSTSGWWDWKPAKKALEQLYMEGELMVSSRDGFQKIYDLTERVLPAGINSSMPTTAELASHLLAQQLRCHGFVSLKGVTYLRRNTALRKAVKSLVEHELENATLEQIQLPSGEIFIIPAGKLEQSMPRLGNRLHILSPFDNCVIQRDRLKALFGFDYQIECYVPEAKRQYGYFSLPLLYRGEFIGRMDCKAHRSTQHFEIKSLFLEPNTFDRDALINAFVRAIVGFSRFQQCQSWSLTQAQPKKILKPIREALSKA